MKTSHLSATQDDFSELFFSWKSPVRISQIVKSKFWIKKSNWGHRGMISYGILVARILSVSFRYRTTIFGGHFGPNILKSTCRGMWHDRFKLRENHNLGWLNQESVFALDQNHLNSWISLMNNLLPIEWIPRFWLYCVMLNLLSYGNTLY